MLKLIGFILLFNLSLALHAQPRPCHDILLNNKSAALAGNDLFWRYYNDKFRQRTIIQIQQNFELFRSAKLRGDDQIRFLEDLGFVFPLREGEPILAPDMGQIFQRIEQMVEANILTGKITREDALMPILVVNAIDEDHYWREEGGIKITNKLIRFGEPLDEYGTRFLENSEDKEEATLIPQNQFRQLMREGFFPLGGLRGANGGDTRAGLDISEFFHDLAHFGGMIQHPQIMAAYRRNSNRPALPENDMREYIAFEGLAVVRPHHESFVDKILSLPLHLSGRKKLHVKELVAHYTSFSEQKRNQLVAQWILEIPSRLIMIGGAQRDLFTFSRFSADWREKSLLINGRLDRMKDKPTPKQMAEFAVLLHLASRLPPEQWIDALLSGENIHLP